MAIIAASSPPLIPKTNNDAAVINIPNCPKRITRKLGSKFQLLAEA